jgi:Tol biopolymer transport system component/DNA-binding SARP family transcriptional activator
VSGSAAQPRRLAILALLASAGQQGVTREKVLGYLWPETDEERARRGLNQALYALRQDLGSDDVFLGTRDLRLNSELLSSDVSEFEQALAEGKLEDAAARYGGPFLDGFHLPGAPEFERWAEEERAGLARTYAESLEKLARRAEAKGAWLEATGWWRKLAAQDPLNARVAVNLMKALAAAGDRAGALQHARIYEALMEQELDAPADSEVLRLAAEFRSGDGVRSAPAAAAVAREVAAVSTLPAPPAPEPAPAWEPAAPAAAPARRPKRLRSVLIATALAGTIGGLLFLRPHRPNELVPGPTRRVAFDESLELDPSLSPDGRMIAYSAQAGDRFQVFLRQAAGGNAVPVSSALPGSHWRPVWSPDGSRIAFQADGAIDLVDAFGGSPHVLVQPARRGSWVAYPAWSPDGRALAYVEDWAIYLRPIEGGAASLVTKQPAAHSLAWSPDGQWIAFVSGNPVFAYGESPWGNATNLGNIAPSSIWVVRARGGAPQQVTDAQSLNTSPAWMPNSRGLVFVSNREGARDVYRVDLRASGAAAAPPVRLTTGLSAHTISLSTNGKELAYSVFTSTANIWTLPIPKTGSVKAADAQPLTTGTQAIEGITLSPDLQWLAFDSDRDGNQDVFKMPVSGGEPVQLTSSPEDEFVSSWSGDGRDIGLHSYHNGTRRVRLIEATGGEPRDVVSSPPNQRSPGLAPDGRSLVFTSDVSGQLQLYRVSRDGSSGWGAARRLTTQGGWSGRWAPDGHAIVYCRSDGVWLIEPPEGKGRQLVKTSDSGQGPSPELARWSPDSRTIYYKAFDAAGRSSFWSVAAAGGSPRLLVRFDDPSRPSGRSEFDTDGKRLFFTIGTRQSDIWVMELKER